MIFALAAGPRTLAAGSHNIYECIHMVYKSRAGHEGVQATWLACKKTFPNAPISYEAVKQVVQDCGKCAKIRDGTVDNHTPTRALPTSDANAITNVDVLTIVKDKHGYQYAFVFINSFTKYTMIFPAKDETAKTCALCMLLHASTVGVTECNWTDQGSEFCAEVTQELARILGITWTFRLACRPQSSGIVEHQNSEVLRRLRALLLYKTRGTAGPSRTS
jgi:hypothetical protein